MKHSEIVDYAQRLFAAHGDKAEAEAAQNVQAHEAAGDETQAENWRRIRETIRELRQ